MAAQKEEEVGMYNEVLKYGGTVLNMRMMKLQNKILKWRIIPQAQKKRILIPLFKKDDKLDPRNYRGINLLITTLNVGNCRDIK